MEWNTTKYFKKYVISNQDNKDLPSFVLGWKDSMCKPPTKPMY